MNERVSLRIGGMQAARKHHSWSPGRGRGPLITEQPRIIKRRRAGLDGDASLAHGACYGSLLLCLYGDWLTGWAMYEYNVRHRMESV